MIRKKKRSKKRIKNLWSDLDFTIPQTLIISATMLIIFTVVMIITYWQFESVPDSLVVAFFAAFGVEGGYCAWLHKNKKDRHNKLEIPDIPDIPDDGNLEIDMEGEY